MNRVRNYAIATGVLLLVIVIYLVLSVVVKQPPRAYDFTVGTHKGEVIRLSDNYGKSASVVIFIDPQVEGSTELLSRLLSQAQGADVIALSVSALSEEEQTAMLSADILGMEKLCFESSDAIEKYNIGNAPVTYFIDKEGLVRQAMIGPVSDASIQKSLKKITA